MVPITALENEIFLGHDENYVRWIFCHLGIFPIEQAVSFGEFVHRWQARFIGIRNGEKVASVQQMPN